MLGIGQNFIVNLFCKTDRSLINNQLVVSILTLNLALFQEGVVYLTSPGRPTDIGLQLGKACFSCSR